MINDYFSLQNFLLIFTFKRKTRSSEHVETKKKPSNEGISIHVQNQPTIKGKTIKKYALTNLQTVPEIHFHLKTRF